MHAQIRQIRFEQRCLTYRRLDFVAIFYLDRSVKMPAGDDVTSLTAIHVADTGQQDAAAFATIRKT